LRLSRFAELLAKAVLETQRDEWIERKKGKRNDRVLAASLTKAGEALLRDAEVVAKKIEQKMWGGTSAAEVAGLVGLLERCVGNLGDEP